MMFKKENPLLIGKIKLTYEEFYDGYISDENKGKYNVSPAFYGVVKDYPPTSRKIETVMLGDEVSYNLIDIDVAILKSDLDKSSSAKEVWGRVSNPKEITTLKELQKSNIYKVLFVKEDGTFSKRTLLCESLSQSFTDLNNEIYIGKEFYKFISYTYATFIETRAEVKTYDEFQEYYGKYIYGVTLEHNDKILGLTWLDFIMHRPDAHLELGATSSLGGERFKQFNSFHKGDELTITIMAEGFVDTVLKTKFARNPSLRWSNMWYKKIIKKRMEKYNEK